MPLRHAWEDRYRTPTVHGLIAGMEPSQAELLEWFRSALRELQGSVEALAWQGIPWRWSLTYATPGSERPWAYLVPRPARALVAMPIHAELATEVCQNGFSRTIRDGVSLAPVVGGIRWTQWELTSRTHAEEVLALARLAHRASLSATAQIA